jgi:soluble cytochrome b562
MRIGFELAVDNGRETILPEDFKAAVEIDSKFRQDKRDQFKEERRQVETDYRKNFPEMEKEIDSWEWETDEGELFD